MRGIPNPWELFEPTTEYGRAAVAAMKRIGVIGYRAWVAEELQSPSHRDPEWIAFVLAEGERLQPKETHDADRVARDAAARRRAGDVDEP